MQPSKTLKLKFRELAVKMMKHSDATINKRDGINELTTNNGEVTNESWKWCGSDNRKSPYISDTSTLAQWETK